MSKDVRFGVNYTPTQDWMYQWMEIDPEAVRADFAAIRQLGVDHVRIFPLWPVLQPNRTLIRTQALDDIAAVIDVAAEFDLDVSVDVIQGHMSGFDFVPVWLLNWHAGNMYADQSAIDAQAELVAAVYDVGREKRNFLGLTIGNELNQFLPGNPAPMPASVDQIHHWITSLLAAPHDRAESHVLVHSTSDLAWYVDDHSFVPTQVSQLGDMSTVHSWIFNGTAKRYGAMSPESLRHGEWMIEMAKAFAIDPHRQVWLQEVGAPSLNLADAEMPDFCERTMHAALTCEDLYAITWWCSHDVNRDLSDFKELEYTLGLLDVDNQLKPAGHRFADMVARAKAGEFQSEHRTIGVVVDVDDTGNPLSRKDLAPGGKVFERWHTLREQREPVTLVTSAGAADPAHLHARGITSVDQS